MDACADELIGGLMFMNLHELPEGKHMYTAFIGDMESHDEMDFVADAWLQGEDALAAAVAVNAERGDLYDLSDPKACKVLAVADQSLGSDGMVYMDDEVRR